MISVVESEMTLLVPYMIPIDPLERAWMGDEEESEDEMMDEIEQVLNMSCKYVHGFGRFEELNIPITLTPPKPSIEEVPKLELKPLPAVLCERKKAIWWTIADIKGIGPSFCMHKIFLEYGHRLSVEQQRILNPIMKEVVKKEVIKRLDAGIIFPISDSNWVSPVQRVPKKGGMTVVQNEKNELMPTRTVTGWRVCIDYRRVNKATRKDHFPLPFIDQMLDRLAGHKYYCFLDGYSGLLEKDVTFNFDEACLKAFEDLKKRLVVAPIIVAPDWSLPFELMCDASDHAIGAVLGQRKDKMFHSIYYAIDNLSRLEKHEHVEEGRQSNEAFPDEQLFAITQDPPPWYEDYVNYIVSGVLQPEITSEARKRFLHDVNFYYWDELFLYKQCADQLMRRCIPEKGGGISV
ncbi:uncharacterized protein [Nicotiana tomentosiformis]|uniref:uncharacterized protein n=1 Tax=Nicotiana tomentosiformis TaxID=4098 RepID=UPI00388C8E10